MIDLRNLFLWTQIEQAAADLDEKNNSKVCSKNKITIGNKRDLVVTSTCKQWQFKSLATLNQALHQQQQQQQQRDAN